MKMTIQQTRSMAGKYRLGQRWVAWFKHPAWHYVCDDKPSDYWTAVDKVAQHRAAIAKEFGNACAKKVFCL